MLDTTESLGYAASQQCCIAAELNRAPDRSSPMANKFADEFARHQQTALKALKELADINALLAERMFEHQKAVLAGYLQSGTDHIQQIAGAKDFKTLISLHTDYAKASGEQLLGYTQETVEILDQARAKLAAWFEKGMEDASKISVIAAKKAA
jgi:phasin family protein